MYNKRSISDYYRDLTERLKLSVLEEDSDFFGDEDDTQSLVDALLSDDGLRVIEINDDKNITMNKTKEIRVVDSSQRDMGYWREGSLNCEYELINICIPIKRNISIHVTKELRTSTTSMSWSLRDYKIFPESIDLNLITKGYRIDLSQEEIIGKVNELKKNILEWTERVNKDVESENQKIRKFLTELISKRKKELEVSDKGVEELSKKLGFDLI
ncbi:MAG: hypothetical protein ACI870_000270 [Crocinitomicaceae bacterium]|jgi:hypothetical protein